MISDADLARIVMRANLAPSVHNMQPARWRRMGDDILIGADTDLILPVGDPDAKDAGLSCGAALEATILALGDIGRGAEVTDLWDENDHATWPGHRLAAKIQLVSGDADPLAKQLENRMTWRASFAADVPSLFGWSRPDTRLVMDAASRAWIAQRNDDVSLQIMRGRPFRRELLSWMRLSAGHPRYRFDGLGREAMQMDVKTARGVRWALGPFWGLFDLLGATKAMTAEADATLTAPIIACFHRPATESPVTSGRAYLRMWLEAANLGLAGWPMAALTDDKTCRDEMSARFAIGPDRRHIQVMRLGAPTGPAPQKARRPLAEILL